jgi:hypothetical protein
MSYRGQHAAPQNEPSHPGHADPPSTHWTPPAPEPDDGLDAQAVAVELRNQVVDRLRSMNARHGQQVWDRQGNDPLAPHGLAYFYTDTELQRGRPTLRVRTGTRLFLDGPEAQDLPRLLFEQGRIADGYRQAGHLDPLTQLVNRHEPMNSDAAYFGVGVSTLDTPERPWRWQIQAAASPFDLAGRCFARLVDGTWLLLERGGANRHSELRIWSTETLHTSIGQSMRHWSWGPHLPEMNDPHTRDIWQWLNALHDLLRTSALRAGDPRGGDHGR